MTASQLHPLELIDETLDINATDNYDLTLELAEEGVSIAVLDLLRGKYVMLRHYPREVTENDTTRSLEDIIDNDDFLKRHYRKVFIIIPSLLHTLVPSPVYEPRLRDDYFRFNHRLPEAAKIYANTLPFPDAVLLFSSEDPAVDRLLSRWPDVSPWHHTKPLLQHVSAACRTSEDRYIHLHFGKSFITVAIAEKRNLTFCNSFACTTSSDAAYFLFSVLDRKGIKSGETIFVSGSVEPYSEAHIALLNFSPSVKFASPVIRQSLSYVMNEVHLHRWLNLFTAAACE